MSGQARSTLVTPTGSSRAWGRVERGPPTLTRVNQTWLRGTRPERCITGKRAPGTGPGSSPWKTRKGQGGQRKLVSTPRLWPWVLVPVPRVQDRTQMGRSWPYVSYHLMYSDWLVFAHFYCIFIVIKSYRKKKKIGTSYRSRNTPRPLSCLLGTALMPQS